MRYRVLGADKETGDEVELIVQATGTLAAAEMGSAKGIMVADVIRLDSAGPGNGAGGRDRMAAADGAAGLDFSPVPSHQASPSLVLDPVATAIAAPAEASMWYYTDGSSQQGPLTEAQLGTLLQRGQVTFSTLVWREGMQEWSPLSQAGFNAFPQPLEAPEPMTVPVPAAQPTVARAAEMDRQIWFYRRGREQVGPLTARALKTMLHQGKVSYETMVRNKGLEQWITLRAAKFAGGDPTRELNKSEPYSGNPFVWYFRVLGKYAVFSGRATRTEFWFFTLASAMFGVIIYVLDTIIFRPSTPLDIRVLGTLYQAALLLPTLAVWGRRLHDSGRSDRWLLPVFAMMLVALAVPFALRAVDDEHTRSNILAVGGLIELPGALVALAALVFACFDSQQGDNQYGRNLKEDWQ